MVKISERLCRAASLISDGNRLADVGTDHGYVPIYLLQQQRIPRAIAMDINRGPLERAKEHIRLYRLEEYIETRLSDGVKALKADEADSILIAGMGGGLVMHILEAGQDVCRQAKELVLQPQSELERVRRFLWSEHYCVDAEEMVKEDGKYYPMMRVYYDPEMEQGEEPSECDFCYGRLLLKQRHPVLKEYLQWECRIQENILAGLQRVPCTQEIQARICEVEHVLEVNARALAYYE
ncbi:MAG: class I SAM-dependent methyltransferase [Clostridiales bacterium]|nr:class I SAM-dependent methyltransferase [Roseburia sp.]MDD7635607.1 class I SAM-dependent methyltransferase [Clostridiales bacterium]MDY4112003.1 class I SAM-dependent methyltransferase [Roseburia sp.]